METTEGPMPWRRIDGKREIEDLTLATVDALEEADLNNEIQDLSTRVFGRGSKLLFETRVIDDDLCDLRFKPMVELVLYEIQGVARASDLSTEERRRLIRWMLDVTGF